MSLQTHVFYVLAVFGVFAIQSMPTASAGGEVCFLNHCDATSSSQAWQPGTVAHEFVQTHGGACLDVEGYSTAPESSVWAYSPCHPDDKDPAHQNEAWTVNADGTIVEISTGLCLDAHMSTASYGVGVVVNKCNGSPSQNWKWDSATKLVHSGADASLCLDAGELPWRSPCAQEPSKSMPFCDTTKSLSDRVANLVANLTQAEKVTLFGNGAASVPRLNIPGYQWWSEALHGVAGSPGVAFGGPTPNATSFPQVITTGSSFNKTLYHAIGAAVSTEARGMNNVGRAGLTFWAPNINLVRDPRWGRGQETPGEDPYGNAMYAANFVPGMQAGSDPNYLKVSSCLKHFYAYDLENWHGVDRHHFDAIVSAQDEADTYFVAFEAGVELGKASAIMCSYNSVNGVPSCANKYSMTTKARETWGFDGYITSDCGAVSDVIDTHHYTSTSDQTVLDVLSAGMDIDCGSYVDDNLNAALNDKSVSMSLVDTALSHLFSVQFRLGLFDPASKQPYRQIPPTVVDSEAHQQLALDAARQGMVLLRNDNGALPFADTVKNVVVVGPNGDATTTMQGNYYGTAPYLISPVQGINSYAKATYVQGCDVACTSTSGFAAAASAAASADATIIVVGIDQSVESEGHDRTEISLPGNQNQLITTVAAASKGPVVVVLMAGGPVDISVAKNSQDVDAIMFVGYPGQSGGQAIADVLFGTYNPGGRLPYTLYPASFVNEVSMFDMEMRPNKTSGNPGHTYRFYTGTPVYEYGTGLSYTTFETNMTASSTISSEEINTHLSDSSVTMFTAQPLSTVDVKVTNTGKLAGSYVVILFVKPPAPGQNGAPLKSNRGFARVFLQPGESTVVEFPVTAYDLTFADEAGVFRAIPGTWTLQVDNTETQITVV